MKNCQIFIFTDLDGSLLNHNNFEFKEIKDFILDCIKNNEIDILIHGHTHRPEIKTFEDGSIKVVLGSWEDKGWVFEYSPEHFELRSFVI